MIYKAANFRECNKNSVVEWIQIRSDRRHFGGSDAFQPEVKLNFALFQKISLYVPYCLNSKLFKIMTPMKPKRKDKRI
jgi:hypothetical protein